MIALSSSLCVPSAPALQVGVDVLDHHRGIIDKDADCKGKAAQCHDVDRLAKPGQRQDRTQDRKRDGGGDDQCRAPTTDEQQDGDTGEARGGHHLLHHVLDRGAHEGGGVVERRDRYTGRQSLEQSREAWPARR